MAATTCHFCGLVIGGRFAMDDGLYFHPECLQRIETVMESQHVLCPECLNYIMPTDPRKSAHGLVFHEKCAEKADKHDLSHLDDDKDVILTEIKIIELGPATEEAVAGMYEARQIEKAQGEQPNIELLAKDGWNPFQIEGLVVYRTTILATAHRTVFMPGDRDQGYANPS